MKDMDVEAETTDLVFEYELEASPEKVWRAIVIPEFRERWLPERDLANAEPVFAEPGNEIHFRLREDVPPFLESIVEFQLMPGSGGGTILKITHGIVDTQLSLPMRNAANSNEPTMMLAA
ncbi:MAG: polyketide cyclase [Roseibium sp.]|uniref:SRPBCC family protein n=1 Tax=Roseibium sp. TaxID=1936156 RepID=UPI00261BEEB0|nr:polyketide cyclase [Roseibium sp.]MCV0425198.1 polyketide cyclase [Roseibium sp.]